MNKLKKLFALLSFILYLFIGTTNLIAADDDDSLYIDSGKEQGGGFFATAPECTNGMPEAIVAAITLIIAGKNFIIPGLISLATGASGVGKVIAITRIGIGTAMIGVVAVSFSTSFQCFFSFVQDPITYQDDDKTKSMLKEKKGGQPGEMQATNSRWEAAGVPYSKNISVCARPIFPYLSLIGLISGDSYSCYGTNSKWGVDNKFYDGPKAFLCPEEWRYHGYRAEIKEDSEDKKKEKFVIPGNGQEGETAGSDEKSKFMRDLLDMRQHDGPLKCYTANAGETFSLHGFKYKIIKMGAKLCAKLQGISLPGDAMIPSFTGGFIVGCHYTTPDDPSPLCDKSEKVFLKEKKKNPNGSIFIDPDTEKPVFINTINPSTGEPIIIDYDNSKCFSCFVGESCHSATSGHSKAVLPLTSYIMECVHNTIKNVMFGCVDSTTMQRPKDSGLLYMANKELIKITYILITLAVVLFGYKILFSNNLPKNNEMVMFLLKIAVVLYMVHGTSENNGQQWLYNRIQQLSSGLGALVMRASVDNTGICHFTDELYQVTTQGNTPGLSRDLSYIKPYDIMDCLLFFYIGGALVGYDHSKNIDFGEILANSLPRLFMIIMPLFAIFDLTAFIVALALFFFAIMVISIATWFISLMVLSTIMLFFLILISPIVLPMMLFGYTKSFFDNWIKEVMAYTLFPPLLFLFFGLMLAIFNAKMFGETKFSTIDVNIMGRNAKHSVFTEVTCDKGSTIPVCKSCEKFMIEPKNCDGCDPASLACQIRVLNIKKGSTQWSQGTLFAEKSANFFVNMLESVGYIILMAVIFMTLVTTVAFLVAKVVGGSRSLYEIIQNGISPMTAFMKVSKYGLKPTIMANKAAYAGLKKAFGKKKNPESSAGTK